MTGTLYRSRTRRVIGGVAAGLGKYLSFDPILVRVVLIFIALLNGVGVILYIILWIIITEEPIEVAYNMGPSSDPADPVNPVDKEMKSEHKFTAQDIESKLDEQKSGTGRTVAGVILVAIGMIFLLDNLFPYFDFEDFIPVALVGFGIALIWHSLKK